MGVLSKPLHQRQGGRHQAILAELCVRQTYVATRAQHHVDASILFKLTVHKICRSLGVPLNVLMEVPPGFKSYLDVLQRAPATRRLLLLKSEVDTWNTAGSAATHFRSSYAKPITCSGLLASSLSTRICKSRSTRYGRSLAISAMERTLLVLSCTSSRHVSDSSVPLVRGFGIWAVFANLLRRFRSDHGWTNTATGRSASAV